MPRSTPGNIWQEDFPFHICEIRLKTKTYPAAKGKKSKPQKGGEPHAPPGAILGQERTDSMERD